MMHLRIFAKGLAMTLLPMLLALAVARYVPSLWIGLSMVPLLLVLIYQAGANFAWPWEKKS